MKHKPSVSIADLYALRTFLDVSTQDRPEMEHKILGWKHYFFTAVNRDSEGVNFLLRRRPAFIEFYDVLEFRYSPGKVEIKEGEFRDDSDREIARMVIETLRGRCYKDLISNLDDLLK